MFLDAAALRDEDARRALAALAILAGGRRRAGREGRAPSLRRRIERVSSLIGGAARRAPSGRCRGDAPVELRRGDALDAAAELAELAGRLHRDGDVVGAFALEGIAARILEALVGAGGVDST